MLLLPHCNAIYFHIGDPMLTQCEKKLLRDSQLKNSSTTRESSLKCAASPRWLQNVHFLLILMVNESYFYKFFTSHWSIVKGMKKLGVDTKQQIFRNFMQLSIVKVVEEDCLSSWVQGCQGALEFFSHYDGISTSSSKTTLEIFMGRLWVIYVYCMNIQGILGQLETTAGNRKAFLMNLNEF